MLKSKRQHPLLPLIYPDSHGIIEGYQIGQVWFLLHESILTAPNTILFFHNNFFFFHSYGLLKINFIQTTCFYCLCIIRIHRQEYSERDQFQPGMEASNGKDENRDWTWKSEIKPNPNVMPRVCVKVSRWALFIERR